MTENTFLTAPISQNELFFLFPLKPNQHVLCACYVVIL